MNTRKVWEVGQFEESADRLSAVNEMAIALGITALCAKLLHMRGYDTVEKARAFLKNTDLSIYDPFAMKDMRVAAERVLKGILEGENIAILGDYDADGVSATALLYTYLESKNPDMKLGYYIPDRFSEGYGMSRKAIDCLHERGATLVITVDNGITAIDEVAYASSLGIDVVVTDHHECREVLPAAVAVVDPHRSDCQYPFPDLAGVGVAFKLITAIEALSKGEDTPSLETVKSIYRKYADLAAIGTIADVMPVINENRAIIVRGLAGIGQDPRPGLRALVQRAGVDKNGKTDVTATSVSFFLAPRINAAGRMEHASHALELLLINALDENCDQAAELLADHLCDLNTDRQKEESDIMRRLDECVAEQCNLSSDRVLVVANDEWHPGVIGIVASKVVEKYDRPAILITFHGSTEGAVDEGDVGRGSGRSIEGVNLIEAISACGDCLLKYGGHELAAGLSVARGQVDRFRREINEYIKEHETEEMWTRVVRADMELAPSEVGMKFAQEVQLLEPFGIANPTPVFMMRDVTVVTQRAIGNGSHIKFRLEKNGVILSAVMFHAGYEVFGYNPGEKIDILFNLDINEYNGSRTVQLLLRDTRYSEQYTKEQEAQNERYLAIMDGARFEARENIIPKREEFALIYRILRTKTCESFSEISEKQLLSMVNAGGASRINSIKLRVILDVLHEMKLCEIRRQAFDLIEFHVDLSAAKVDLESSPLLCRLKRQCG